MIMDDRGIEMIFQNDFKTLFSTESSCNIEEVLERVCMKVSEEDNRELIKDVMKEEIKEALDQMSPLKERLLNGPISPRQLWSN